jgi:hypothetical protein
MNYELIALDGSRFIVNDSLFDANRILCAKLDSLGVLEKRLNLHYLLDYKKQMRSKEYFIYSDVDENSKGVWGKQRDCGLYWQSVIFQNLTILFNIYPEMQQQYIEQHLKHIKDHE